MLISILTGFLAGGLHVISGADHLAAMSPSALNKPRVALQDGLAWGLGHSTGVLLLSGAAILAKDLVNIEKMSFIAEFLVGIALLVVGILAIRTALGLNIHMHDHNHGSGHQHKHLHFHLLGRRWHGSHAHAVTSLGVLHGLAGASHLVAVFPALALPPAWAIVYMGAYLIGSVFAMVTAVLIISYLTYNRRSRFRSLLFGSAGGLSIATGFFWLQKTSIHFL